MNTLNVTLETQDNESDFQLDASIVTPFSKDSFKRYRGKLRIMDKIHNEIAETLNNKRRVLYETFIPESSHNNHLALMMQVAKQ